MLYLILVSIMIFVSVSLSGLFAPPITRIAKEQAATNQYKCCDSGDGESCKANQSVGFNYDGDRYDLLKSDAFVFDYGVSLFDEHMDPAKTKDKKREILTPNGERIFLNRGDKRSSDVWPECHSKTNGGKNTGYDRLYGKPDPRNTGKGSAGKGCYKIPNELLIYVCRKDSPSDCFAPEPYAKDVKFDIYIRRKDNLMPESIKNCFKPETNKATAKQIVFRPSPEGNPNLQLRTFSFIQSEPPSHWMSPYCKPAIYLYPEKRTELNVSVFPKGKMLLTIPDYPKLGWDVVAEPNGDVFYQNKRYDYLYYEASIPDELIPKPKQGFMMTYDSREEYMRDLVTKLGLNEKETEQFVEYWTPILPKSPYYFVGIIPEKTLDYISPVIITPKPHDIIRITVYFQALNAPILVDEPIVTPIERSGFTAVEWGGIVKRDPNHPFSCFM